MKKKVLLGFIILFFLIAGCATRPYFGVPSKALGIPDEFGQTEAFIAEAEKSPGAQYCPEKITEAKELARKGVEAY